MTEIRSKIDNRLLHIIVRMADVRAGRTDIVPAEQFLQVAALKLPQGTTFKPHRHIIQCDHGRDTRIAQESWVCISGNVEVILYDTDDTILHTDVLTPGDISVTLYGGHNYMILSDEASCWEFKTGPYIDQQHDKTFI